MIHCPTCGSGLRFDIASQKTVCDHCRNSFEPESLPDSVYDDADTAQAFEGFAFMCPDCGAEIFRVIQAPGLGHSETDLHYRAKRAGFKCLKRVQKGEYETIY